jgi:CubicO group peptidase (beta-lactamase class C family)
LNFSRNSILGNKLGITFILIAFLAGCAPTSSKPTPPAYWPTNGWRSAAPEEQGMDSEELVQLVEHIQQKKLDLHSLLIVRNGYLVNELYVYPYSAGQVHFITSVTKSVMGMLVGIAIQKAISRISDSPCSACSRTWGLPTSMKRRKPLHWKIC